MKFSAWVRSSWINGSERRKIWVDSGSRGDTRDEVIDNLRRDQPLVYECSEIEVRPCPEPDAAPGELLEVSVQRSFLSGLDSYREGASIAYGVPIEQVTREQRQIFKERFFLLTYRRGTTRDNVRALVKLAAEMLREELSREPARSAADHQD